MLWVRRKDGERRDTPRKLRGPPSRPGAEALAGNKVMTGNKVMGL